MFSNIFKTNLKVFTHLMLVYTLFVPNIAVFAQGPTDDFEDPYNVGNNQPDLFTEAERERQRQWDAAGADLNDVANEQSGTSIPYANIYPESGPARPATAVAGTAGTCVLSQLAAQWASKLFGKFMEKTAGILANANLVPVYVPGLENKDVGTAIIPSQDGIGYCIANSIIQYISQSTIDWINSGFEGNPVFVDDPARIFKDLKEDTLNSFIDSFGNGFLCRQFDINVRLALIGKERKPKRYNCTYDQALANLKNEPFSFKVFADVTQNPMNNPIGAFLTLDSEFLAIKNERDNTLTQELSWGSGYLSWKDKKTGKTVTPGKIVQSTVEARLQLPTDRLVLADEFDEIIDALINQLVKTAVQETLGSQQVGS